MTSHHSNRRTRARVLSLVCGALAAALAGSWGAGAAMWVVGPHALSASLDEVRIDADPLRVAVIGDIQNGFSEFADLQTKIAELTPDLVVQLGDTVNNATEGRYAALHSSIRAHGAGVPMLVVPGNHDIARSGDGLSLFKAWVGPTEWRFDHGGWCLLGLNNAAGELSAKSRDLLAKADADGPAHGVVVFAHRPETAPVTPAPLVQFAGHIHSSSEFVDAAGTRHVYHGNNCDRSHDADPGDLPTVGILTLGSDGDCSWEDGWTVPRRLLVTEELRRLVVGSLYPLMSAWPVAASALIALLVAAAAAAWRWPAHAAGGVRSARG
ncbi:MAG: hypothetical protein CMJ88_11295 [Planctomycetes bacterium]|nr:hypothetical protein [Planctomycetota bacterium]